MIYKVIESVIGSFSNKYRAMLDEISTVHTFSKGEFVLNQGKHCHYLWFINVGAVKAFEEVEGDSRVTHFFMQNQFFTNYYCWVTAAPSDIAFKTVTDCELIVVSYAKLMALCEQHHIFDTIGRKIAERVYVQEFQLRRLLLNCSAMERYEYLENNTPEVFQLFALKDIASFIGVTDVSLSRIRKERLQNERTYHM